jgi:hypothetical protein
LQNLLVEQQFSFWDWFSFFINFYVVNKKKERKIFVNFFFFLEFDGNE